MKRLILLRHAKSDWHSPYDTDHDRPLNGRGRRAARSIGIVLARSGEAPDLAISSSAVRARSTLELAAEAGGWSCDVLISRDLYGASPPSALEVLTSADDHLERILLVGHQPTWGSLTRQLTGADVVVKTATAIGVDLLVGSWSAAPAARGSLAFLLQPRMFTDGEWDLI